jgi:hypothetical protein
VFSVGDTVCLIDVKVGDINRFIIDLFATVANFASSGFGITFT